MTVDAYRTPERPVFVPLGEMVFLPRKSTRIGPFILAWIRIANRVYPAIASRWFVLLFGQGREEGES